MPAVMRPAPAAPIWAMYIVAAEKTGVPRAALEGTTQNDILKEYVAQKEFLYPPDPSMRLVVDTIEFGTREMPRWNTVSISGYHIREAGSTAVQELAFTIADGMAYGALGTDTGGSCRIPAAYNGIVGYKPTQARVPLDGGVPLSSSLDSFGPLARTVDCCAVLDAVIADERAGAVDRV